MDENEKPDQPDEAQPARPAEKLGLLAPERGGGQPSPTYPNGRWRHWTDDLDWPRR